MTLSLRNRRIAVWRPVTSQTDGVVATRYVLRGTWWGRIEPPTGRERQTGLAPEHTITAVCTLSESAVVAQNDVIVDEDDVIYDVRAVLPRAMLAEQEVYLQRADLAQATYTLAVS